MLFLVGMGIYCAVFALGNQYLRTHNFLSPVSTGLFTFFLCAGLYLFYKWFCRHIDRISNAK